MQHFTLDKLLDHCPLFRGQDYQILHNKEIWRTARHYNTLCEIDTIYNFKTYTILLEEKTRDSESCHRKMNKQMRRYKKYQRKWMKDLKIDPNKPVYYFYAHFERDIAHIEYIGRVQKARRISGTRTYEETVK
jgi:tRNA A37 N6-isopentenylltransferase MiaA